METELYSNGIASCNGELFAGSFNEEELCAAYGYELAMSPTETIMPDDEDEHSWLIDDISQTGNILTDAQQFDLLETFVFSSQYPKCSDDETLNLSCMVKLEPLMDEGGICCCQSQDDDIYLNLDSADKEEFHTDPSPPLNPSQPSQEASTEDSRSATTEFVQSLSRRMTLNQKMKFYAWFNSGLSIAEAAEKSKIPDLIPPPIRHPNCKFSKRRLNRLSKLLPNVFLQRQFVYETYFAGVDPRNIMRALLIELNSEDLISTFENQFTMEVLAIEEKRRQRAAMAVNANVASAGESILESVDLTVENSGGDGANFVSQGPVGSPDKMVTSPVESPREGNVDGDDKTVEISAEDEANMESAHDKSTRREVEDRSQDLTKLVMEGDHLMKYCYWRNEGLTIAEAVSRSIEFGLADDMVPHPRCSYSWEDLLRVGQSFPDIRSKERFLIDVFYNGKDPGKVLFLLRGGNGDINQTHAEHLRSTERISRLENRSLLRNNTKTFPKEPSMPSGFDVDLVSNPNEKAVEDSGTSISSAEQHSPHSIIDPITAPAALCEASELLKLPLNQRKNKLCNQGVSPSDALVKARMQGLTPKCVPHPNNKYSPEEIKILAAVLPRKLKPIFHTEVIYGGKDPETVVKSLTDDVDLHDRFYSNLKLVSSHPGESRPSVKSKNRPIKSTDQSKCKYSGDEQLSSRLPPESARYVHGYGGENNMVANHSNPSQLKTNPVMTEKEHQSEMHRQSRRMVINYLVAQGLTPAEASAQLDSSNKPVEELEEFVEKAEPDEQEMLRITDLDSQSARRESVQSYPQCKNVPLGSPDHPSTFLDDGQLVNYYLLISNGFSREDAVEMAKKNGLPMHQLYRQHHLKSRLNFHDLQKMSKLLPTKALAKLFVIETYYGGNDPVETMQFLASRNGTSSAELSQTHEELASNSWYSHSMTAGVVKSSTLSAEDASTTPSNGYSHPGSAPQHRNHGYPPRKASVGVFTATIADYAHPRSAVAQKIQPQLMNNPGMIYKKSSSHTSDHESWKDLSQNLSTNAPVLEHQTDSTKNMSESSVDPKLTDSEVKCFIVPTNYPIEFLTEPQMDAIESNILEAILEMEEDDVKPSFKDSFRKNGHYGFICCDEFSVNWLRRYLRKYVPYENASLQLLMGEPTSVKANAVFPLCKADADEKILKFVERQNHGLNVSRWSVVQRWDNDESTVMDLYIDAESAEVIRSGTRISFKLGSAEIFVDNNGGISSRNDSRLTDALPSVESSAGLPHPPPLLIPPPPLVPHSALMRVESSACPPLPPPLPIQSPPPLPPPPHSTALPNVDSSACPPLPPPLPNPSPPPPPPPPPLPATEEATVIDTSLKGLLFGSASNSSHQKQTRRGSPRRSSSLDKIHRKRGRRHRSSSGDQRCPDSRTSFADRPQKRPKKLSKRRTSRKDPHSKGRRRSSSKSRDTICSKKRPEERRRRHASKSPIHNRRSSDSFYGKPQISRKSRLTSPISSDSDFSIKSVGSCENMEYVDYLK